MAPVVLGLPGRLFSSAKPGVLAVAILLVLVPVGRYLLELLHSRAKERSQKVTLELVDTLDQMTIAGRGRARRRGDGQGRLERQGSARGGAGAHAAGHSARPVPLPVLFIVLLGPAVMDIVVASAEVRPTRPGGATQAEDVEKPDPMPARGFR